MVYTGKNIIIISILLLPLLGFFTFSSAQKKDDANKTYTVTSIHSPPFVLHTVNETTGEETYSGFIVDILDDIAKMNGFKYKIQMVRDGKYGAISKGGNWSGMVGEIINEVADIAAAPLTVTAARQKVIDFSAPFQKASPAILLRKPKNDQVGFVDRFMRLFVPMSSSVWLHTFIGMLATAIALYVICYFSPIEWRKMAIHKDATFRERESFTCLNSFWFVASCLVWQGYERTPRSVGARIIVFFWWVFCALFLMTYTASLTNYLRIISQWDAHWSSMPVVGDLQELSNQNVIKYGMIEGGSTSASFANSNVGFMRNIYTNIKNRNSFHSSINDGVDRIRKSFEEPYAFIMESPSAMYLANRKPCDLMLILDPLAYERYFAFGFKRGSNRVGAFNQAIQEMRESGRLNELKNIWWKDQCASFDNVLQKPARESFYSVTLGSFSGVLIMLAIGVILGSIVAGIEGLVTRRKYSVTGSI
ncbi:glutamate receptor 2 [Octopus sinensis]|uniref:Glutamate receptor 2 n=1 Tax=Octopus sinensis TaxID=2607531 RepID=A0A6P7S5N8_9MOLL|nr:glutamate receptor 2 [Octopus sinensis]